MCQTTRIKYNPDVSGKDYGKCYLIADEVNQTHHTAIVNSLTYIYQKCYPNSHLNDPYSNILPNIVVNPLSDLSENVYRRCSNKECNQARVGKKRDLIWT